MWIGGAASLHKLPSGVDAIVSLCRVVDGHLPAGVKHLDVRLIDKEGDNANLDFVLLDTVRAIERLRAEGCTLFLHCVDANSRTPTVAALYGARKAHIDVDDALREVLAVLPTANPNADFRAALRRLHPQPGLRRDRVDAATPLLVGRGWQGGYAMTNPRGGPLKPSTRASIGAAHTWGPYWDILFPPQS